MPMTAKNADMVILVLSRVYPTVFATLKRSSVSQGFVGSWPSSLFPSASVMESHHSSSDFDHGNSLTPGLSTIVSGTATMIDSNAS